MRAEENWSGSLKGEGEGDWDGWFFLLLLFYTREK